MKIEIVCLGKGIAGAPGLVKILCTTTTEIEKIATKQMKRLVFYFPGYDLRPVNRTFPLIRTEFQSFLQLRALDGGLGEPSRCPQTGDGTAAWEGHVNWPEGRVDTRFVQLGWQDVIQPDFDRSWPRILVNALRSFALYAWAGGYRAAWKSNWRHALFCLYPAACLLVYLLASLLPPLLLASPATETLAKTLPGPYAGLISWSIFLAASAAWLVGIFALVRSVEHTSYFRYLMNSWYFIGRLARNEHLHMLERIEEHADAIVAMADEARDDEVVLVSHSCGTFVAIYILAAVLRRDPDFGARKGGFAFVTLGPAFDCLGGFGAQHGFGEAMATVARSNVDWTDLYSPHDPICGGRTPPIARYAARTKADVRTPEPRRFSVRVPDRMPPATYRYLRYRFFKLHFCYFLASVTPGLFDFFRLTIGPKPAAEQLKTWETFQGQD